MHTNSRASRCALQLLFCGSLLVSRLFAQEASHAHNDAPLLGSVHFRNSGNAAAQAYWLEALTYSHLVWNEEDLARSQKAFTRLAPTPALRLASVRPETISSGNLLV